jgi:protein-S-isoprenylcysteine O-methyltransferase Ste14
MVVAAVVLSVVWFLLAFVVRVVVQLRMTGDSGVRADGGGRFSAAWWTRVGFTLAVVLVVVGPALAAADVVGLLWSQRAVAVVGLVIAVAGIVATFVAQLAMGRSWRIGVDPAERTDLVTSGVFAVVRNPIFTTMAATAVGLTLMAPTFLGFAALVLLLVALELQVRAVEEPYLLHTHGSTYTAYATRTGRFLPKLPSR